MIGPLGPGTPPLRGYGCFGRRLPSLGEGMNGLVQGSVPTGGRGFINGGGVPGTGLPIPGGNGPGLPLPGIVGIGSGRGFIMPGCCFGLGGSDPIGRTGCFGLDGIGTFPPGVVVNPAMIPTRKSFLAPLGVCCS